MICGLTHLILIRCDQAPSPMAKSALCIWVRCAVKPGIQKKAKNKITDTVALYLTLLSHYSAFLIRTTPIPLGTSTSTEGDAFDEAPHAAHSPSHV